MSADSESDAALDWLLSIAATCTSSPIPTTSSSPPDFTEWLHISPSAASTSDPSSPLLDVSSSTRVNVPSSDDGLGYRYIYKLHSSYDGGPTSTSANTSSNSSSAAHTDVQAPGIFNQHHRMLSLESTSATLINTPSPRTLGLFSPAKHILSRSSQGPLSPAPLFASPASQLIQDLQKSPFGQLYYDAAVPSLAAHVSDFSPVVRADKIQEYLEPVEAPAPKTKKRKRRTRNPQMATSFMERLHDAPAFVQAEAIRAHKPIAEALEQATNVAPPALLSPCKIAPARSPRPQLGKTFTVDVHATLPSQDAPLLPLLLPSASLSARSLFDSPLTPLTPLTSSPAASPISAPVPPKITLKIKHLAADPAPATPVRRSKRPRRATIIESSPVESEFTPSEQATSPEPGTDSTPVFTNRTLPASVEISPNFPLFYRRLPLSAYYQASGADSPYSLCNVAPPGGLYNPPRSVLDLYTPRFVKGKGVEKVGLCPICVEPLSRGGENKKLWFAMKFSAFNYHMQYAHGISASTGQPFSPPTSFRTVRRPNPGKKERHQIQQGKCHKCDKWIAVEGIKDMESKVKELHWWKHAAACHHESTIEGEHNYYEEDEVYIKLMNLADLALP
ncbi:hypothetical protein NLJ89_g9411 [Agrocybe chaxingu]|uniref:Transcription regulator Rua1 C-terminal domain-containing protein n=1 Tax=Agrocybe chaxingu TaxID=84603 RepID=A0A9W8JQV3_9AGAR|nr:hypothetical protein NLJ89_g9411 [Agrocybe chaxingu]